MGRKARVSDIHPGHHQPDSRAAGTNHIWRCDTTAFHSKGTNLCFTAACLLLAAVLLSPSTARADFSLGDAANFAVVYEGYNGNTFQFSNSGITGNIGIGNTGKFDDSGGCSGQCLITGVVQFSAANTGQFKSSTGTTYTPALSGGVNPLYSQSNVTNDLNALNSLSSTLGGESGTAVTIQNGGSLTASNGKLDANGNRVFTAAMSSFDNGNTFTINGANTDYVVINIANTNGHGFNGSVVLSGGITSDHVLFNLTGSNTLTISTNGATTTGTFLNPTGNIQINNSVLDGRLFGGDTQNLSFVSGAYIVAPAPVPVPGAILLFAPGFAGLAAIRRRFRK